ncbi:MAG: hypothetical protein KGO96_09285 [Elusimicrobia bacterium]|nr:hypothetical protein [Elusimicrobiota bacterium]MDE2236700.1 hypothetical protein [Elusimicrobiota bacterium]MDE2426082.1 hypothetical protein [Elusimicrobiota bacterium]
MRRWPAVCVCACAALAAFRLPARAEISVVDGLTQQYTVKPGGVYEGSLHVRNLGDAVAHARIYQTDYLFYCDGRNVYGKPGRDPRSNARWITLERDRLTIPPHQTAAVNYTIRVSTARALSGTYWSLVMIEEANPPPAFGKRGDLKPQVGIRQIVRYGVQVVTHVGDTGAAKVNILREHVVRRSGKAFFELDLANDGQRWIIPDVSLELFDRSGARAGVFHGRKMRIYPGTSIRQDLDLTGVAPGRYKGLIMIDGGGEDVFGSRATITL